MLGMKKYPKEYIDACRSRVDADLAAYRKLAAATKNLPATNKTAIEAFETTFFNNMVLMLDYLFVHRLTGIEGKDGNPLNEVRVLCDSMLGSSPARRVYRGGNNMMTADESIKLSPEKSVLKYQTGDQIRLKEADFLRLSEAFFAEIEGRYL